MKKIISCILAAILLFCSAVALADEVKEVVIDTEVPVFNDLEDDETFTGSKKIEIADLSKVDWILLKVGTGTVEFAERTFKGYEKIESEKGLSCINFTPIYEVSDVGDYMIYAKDEHGHDIAVRFEIKKKGTTPTDIGGGGGGGGGGGSSTKVVEPPYANGDPENMEGNLIAGEKITLDSDTGNVKIYYTTDGSNPTTKSTLYDDSKGITLKEGQILKALAYKNKTASEVSQWKCVAAPKDPEPSTPDDSTGSSGSTGSIVKDVLETENHIVYLVGYTDGTFGPDNNMTRAEVAAVFARLMKQPMEEGVKYESAFTDINPEAWYANYVGYIEKSGIVSGYQDGSFKPENPISRAEFVAMASRFVGTDENLDCEFTDVSKEHWAYNCIAFAAKNGWVSGYADKTFKPDNTITRAEVGTIVNNMLARSADKEYVDKNKAELITFSDVSEAYWAYYNIAEATNAHDYEVKENKEIWK